MKKIIQTYKPGKYWISPIAPGLGDFIRGICYLFEKLEGTGIELRIDISQTEFSTLIDFDQSFFHIGDESEVATAEEFVTGDFLSNPKALYTKIDNFLLSEKEKLYLCTNLGKWNRTFLPEKTREFVKKFYSFNDKVVQPFNEVIADCDYEVLSIRTGDKFKERTQDDILNMDIKDRLKKYLFFIIENKIIPYAKLPIFVTSDSYALKCELAKRYNFMVLPHVSSHGAYGNALPVAMDLNLVKNSKYNYHINVWQPWWSGFSHYTSLIFQIPTTNFRTPLFVREEITSSGRFRIPEPPGEQIKWMRERLVSKWERLTKQSSK